MILAALCFALMLGCVKVARAELLAVEIIFWRGLIAVPITVLIALPFHLVRIPPRQGWGVPEPGQGGPGQPGP